MGKKISFHVPLQKGPEIQEGRWFECERDRELNFRLRSGINTLGKPQLLIVKVQAGSKIQVKKIIDSIPRAVIMSIDIVGSEGEIQNYEVAYPITLFQHYFREAIQEEIKLIGYTKAS